MKRETVFGVFFIALTALLFSQQGILAPDRWLVLGPLPLSDGEQAVLRTPGEILEYDFVRPDQLRPEPGLKVKWADDRTLQWRAEGIPPLREAKAFQVTYLALYLESRRWIQTELSIAGGFPTAVYLDGVRVQADGSGGGASSLLTLDNGKHLLLVKIVAGGDSVRKTDLKVTLQNREAFRNVPLLFSLEARHRLGIAEILDATVISDTRISPDGAKAAVVLSQRKKSEMDSAGWIEIVGMDDGRTLFSTKSFGPIGHFRWLKDSRSFSFTRSDKERTSVYVYRLEDNSQRLILPDVKNFSDCWWSPGNAFLIYSQSLPEKKGEKGVTFVRDIADRSHEDRGRCQLTLLYPESGVRHPLSGTDADFVEAVIAPDGKKALLVKSEPDPQNRPYTKATYDLLDFSGFRRKRLMESHWLTHADWSPDSNRLLLLGGPSAFDGLGKNLKEGLTPNEFDVQAYVYDLKTGKAEAITRSFDPSINSAFWHPGSNRIYFQATDKDYVRVYQYSYPEKKFSRISVPPDNVGGISFSEGKRAVFFGSGAADPQKLYRLDLASGTTKLLRDYNRREFDPVNLGRVENWNFKTSDGTPIAGCLYYPDDFDARRTYPCIVYYYGGTTPVSREFGGRYPKDWYAANGYLVYVLQPSGAIGFGQNFSALHVNDWGEVTSDEILQGVRELLRTHPFIDPKRVGAMGASYGGFLTQYLAAKTDLFAAYISHAGISSITSYWGMGDWGYSYSAVASAFSFPWNRKDLYVGHSPLYMAERITRPLLLLHGESDNNVPPGESYQMYAALKLLGKEVALVTFAGQQHFILDHDKRVQWMKTIIAWFDRWLKDQPEQWNEMYGKQGE